MVSWLRHQPKRTRIGLDIAASGVRGVQLERSGDSYAVYSAASHQRQGADAGDIGTEHFLKGEALAAGIQGCLRKATFRGRNAIAALNPPAVEFCTLELPAAVLVNGKADASNVVRWEMGRLTNEPIDDVETGYWPLPPTKASAQNAIGVAARRERVSETLAGCAHAGLRCVGVDTAAAALARLGTILSPRRSQEVWGVLDIAYDEARVVLCVGDVPVLVRRAGVGGHVWTRRIADALQLSVKGAEVQKREHGIALTARGTRRTAEEPPADEVASILLSALRSELKSLASEVKRSYEYVLGCYPGRDAADLMLVGGGAATRNLPEFLSSLLGIQVRRASDYLGDDACRLCCTGNAGELSLLFSFEAFASAIGLAIGN